jgi:dUTP pyrophosphatase
LIPEGSYGRIAPRSGLAVHHSIDVGAGVIDKDFRGNIRVVLFNFGERDFFVKPGDRVAQLILERIFDNVELEDCTQCREMPPSVRGSRGFGSSGV